MSWSVITSGPYMDMLYRVSGALYISPCLQLLSPFHIIQPVFGPIKKREDGTIVFATPIGKGHMPMIALSDFGFFTRYTFDNRAQTSGADLKIASDWVGWDYLKETFEKVTGQKAEVIYQSLDGPDSWFSNFLNHDLPLARDIQPGEGVRTWEENRKRWWSLYRDEKIQRDFEWLRKVNPRGHTLESWMRAENYGSNFWKKSSLLKLAEDSENQRLDLGVNHDRIAQL